MIGPGGIYNVVAHIQNGVRRSWNEANLASLDSGKVGILTDFLAKARLSITMSLAAW